jgi:hypothetical protein
MRKPSARPDILPRKPWLLAIGRVLAAEYTAVREPVPERLAALLKKLEGPPLLGAEHRQADDIGPPERETANCGGL